MANQLSTPAPMLIPSQQPAPEPPVLRQMLLVEKVHYTFETWFINLFKTGQLSETENFSIMGMRTEYLKLCWKEEMLWKRWKESSDV